MKKVRFDKQELGHSDQILNQENIPTLSLNQETTFNERKKFSANKQELIAKIAKPVLSQKTINNDFYKDLINLKLPTSGNNNIDDDLKEIGDIGKEELDLGIPSPSLKKVLLEYENTKNIKTLLRFISDNEVKNLQLNSDKPHWDRLVPAKLQYLNLLEIEQDYEGILLNMFNDKYSKKRPIFPQELEYQELSKKVTLIDKVLHVVFGKDTTGFYKLKELRSFFMKSLFFAYTYTPYQVEDDYIDWDDSVVIQNDDVPDNMSNSNDYEFEMQTYVLPV